MRAFFRRMLMAAWEIEGYHGQARPWAGSRLR